MSFAKAIARLYKNIRNQALLPAKWYTTQLNTGRLKFSDGHEFGGYTWSRRRREEFHWVFLSGQAAILLGISSLPALAEDVSTESNSKIKISAATALQKIEDRYVISSEHASKWSVFTDSGREYFMKGNFKQAEKLFLSALQEAKEGFGERNPLVAYACNNLAEIYIVQRAFEDAEPFYLEAINILEEYFGENHINVGDALQKLGHFYLLWKNMEKARVCFERALKIKRSVLGEAHTNCGDTMYYLGIVLNLQGHEKNAENLIVNSIQMLEAAGQGESVTCVRRMQYLAQMYTKTNQIAEGEILLRKIMHIMELSKGWESSDTLLAAERLALAIQKAGRLREAEELFERCLEAWKKILPEVHIQNAANMFYIARVKIYISYPLVKTNASEALAELDMAENLLHGSIRVARQLLATFVKQKGNKQPLGDPKLTAEEGLQAVIILLQSFNFLGMLEMMKLKLESSNSKTMAIFLNPFRLRVSLALSPTTTEKFNLNEADDVFRLCISTFKEFASEKHIPNPQGFKTEYLLCLRRLHNLIRNGILTSEAGNEIRDEIKRVEDEKFENCRK